jgi:hypothetical protein
VRYFANPSTQKVRDAMLAGLIDVIDTPKQGNVPVPGVAWCADNGCFGKGYPGDEPCFVAQDGLENLVTPWDDFDVLFIGGSTEWKLGGHVRALTAEAKDHGKYVHMGRVNSGRRFAYAQLIGCDSADGTTLAKFPDATLPDVLAWLRKSAQISFTGDPREDGTQ